MIRPATCALAMSLALMGGGCYSAPVPAPRSQAGEADLAAAALEVGDYTSAAELYRRALTTTPENLPVHYGLAVALSHLDQKPEAIREFRWVLARGETGTAEVDNARRWLIKAGALAPPSTGAARSESTAANEASNSASAIVEGRVLSAAGPEQGPLKRQQIFLIEQPSRLHHYQHRTDEEGRFRFAGVPPGTYKISDRMSGPPTWRLRVEAKPGQLVFLDLGPANSTRVRDDYPGQP